MLLCLERAFDVSRSLEAQCVIDPWLSLPFAVYGLLLSNRVLPVLGT